MPVTPEILKTARITRQDIPLYRQLGARVTQKGTNGYWVDSVYIDARTVAHLLVVLSRASLDACIRKVHAVGAEAVGRWYRSIVQDDDAEAYSGSYGQVAHRAALHVLADTTVPLALLWGLARIMRQTLQCGDVRVHADGRVDALLDVGWVTLTEEAVDACDAEYQLAAERGKMVSGELHWVVQRVRDFWQRPRPSPEDIRAIIRRTNVGPIDQCGEYLAVPAPANLTK